MNVNYMLLNVGAITENPKLYSLLYYYKYNKIKLKSPTKIKIRLCNIPKYRLSLKINKSFFHNGYSFHINGNVIACFKLMDGTEIPVTKYENEKSIYLYLNLEKTNLNKCTTHISLCVSKLIIFVKNCGCPIDNIENKIGYFTEIPYEFNILK